jgi:UPF0755 protein
MALKTSDTKKHLMGKNSIVIFLVVTALLAVALWVTLSFYNRIFGPNVTTNQPQGVELYLPTNPDFHEVLGLLQHSGAIDDLKGFIWVARRKGYNDAPKGGRYLLKNGMSNNELVNMLRAGLQAPINVTFNNIRTHQDLAGQLAKRLEPDSTAFLEALNNQELLKDFGFEPHTILGMILPNTYQMFWTTTPEGFIKRMHNEYQRFWNEERMQKASELRLTPIQIATLASIVDEETIREDEKPRVAGLYINRLDKGIRLQADPTIKFAIGDFTVQRILNKDLLADSPYNTYKYAGLPPGPIRMPSVNGIKAVLNHEQHDYLYMCAKDDFSGYHAFAKTLRQHNINAARYRQALNRGRIYR